MVFNMVKLVIIDVKIDSRLLSQGQTLLLNIFGVITSSQTSNIYFHNFVFINFLFLIFSFSETLRELTKNCFYVSKLNKKMRKETETET